MNDWGLRFHHFGLATKKPDLAKAFLISLGYEVGSTVSDRLQNVNLIWCSHAGMPAVEIVSPAGTSGPVDNLLKTREGLVYHLAFTCVNLATTLAAIERTQRVICLSEPRPALLFHGRPVSFYNIDGIGIVEIIEDPSPATETAPA
jgi:methylmalonyl-CoA/ethylmalonyl-CoA epimerase